MAKIRYISDARIYFVRVTVVLKNGNILTAIDDTSVDDIDANWYIYLAKAKDKWGGKIDTFQVVQLSKYDPEVRKYIKDNNIHIPSYVQEENVPRLKELKLSEEEKKGMGKLKMKHRWQPGKYRS